MPLSNAQKFCQFNATVRAFLNQCQQGHKASLPAANNELLLPLIGHVAVGQPIGADAHVEREIAIDRYLFRPKPDYLLRVFGFSMINAGILDQDLIAVHRTAEARNGQIVVARVEGEITVKTFERTRSGIFLLPENDDFKPIKINSRTGDFAIEGLYVGAVRMS